jgi:RNA polymerase sigma-70 factor, ECF subfamily
VRLLGTTPTMSAEISAAQSSDEIAAAFTRLQHSLRSYLRRHVREPSAADDLLQEIFVKALKAQNAKRPLNNLTGWLYAVARTSVADYYRASGVPSEEVDENLAAAEADDDHLHQELATCLRPMANQLPAIYRDTLIATDFDGQTMTSIATEQGLSVSAIKSRAARGRAMLKEKLLACCQVDAESGVVTDYRKRNGGSCGSGCK